MKTLTFYCALCLVYIAYADAGIIPQISDLDTSNQNIFSQQNTVNYIQFSAPIQVGQKAYSFKLTSLNGKKIDLSRRTSEGIVVISISSEYPSDTMYFAHLERVYRDYRGADVTVLAVISRQNRDELSALKERFDLSYPILPDPKDTVIELYELETIPTTLIIDNSGIVRYVGTFTHWTDLEERIETVMAAVEGKSPKKSDYATVSAARKSLRSFDRYLRWHAAKALGELGGKRDVPILIALLNDDDRATRWHAIQALGKIGDIRAIAPLSEALRGNDGGVREIAAQALGQIGNKAAMEPLIKTLNDDSPLVRLAVIKALGDMKDERVVSSLVPFLGDDVLPQAAAEALIKQGDLAVSPLVEVLDGSDRRARENAVYTLGKIARRIGPTPIIKILEQKERLDRLRQSARADTARLYLLLGKAYREHWMFDAAIESYQKSLAMLSGKEYVPLVTKESVAEESQKTGQTTTKFIEPAKGEVIGTGVGNIAPNFTALNFNRERVSLYDFRGKAVILYFWALWSGDNAHESMKQIQAFNNIYLAYKEQGVEVLGISTDEKDLETLKSFEDTYDIKFPLLLSNDYVTQLYQITILPAIFFIDRTGKIRKTYTGYKTGYVYDIAVRDILGK
ncbi:MAG: redoxin domain-containing protein [Candidatus Poribacteria bacterium]